MPDTAAAVTFCTASGAYAATMAACALAILEDSRWHDADTPLETITADYWYNVGRRTQAAADLAVLHGSDFATALETIAAAVPCDDDPADALFTVEDPP